MDQHYSSPASQDFIKQTSDSILQSGEGQQTSKEWPQLGLDSLFYIFCLLPPWSLIGSALWKIGLMPAIDQEFSSVRPSLVAQRLEASACNAGDLDSIPRLGRSPGERNSYPLQYSGLENSMDYMVHGDLKELDMTE